MSNVLEVGKNKKKKKMKSRVNYNNKTNESIIIKKKQLNVGVKNSNIFEIENFLTDEEIDENLEIFHKKKYRKSSLPPISEVLSTSNKNNIDNNDAIDDNNNNNNLGNSSLLNNSSVEKPEKSKIEKYAQNTDIFTTKIYNATNKNNKQFLDVGRSSVLVKNGNKNPGYSISGMFSDDLSDTENFEQEFIYISGSDDSQTDLRPSLTNLGMKKTGNFSNVKKEYNIRERKNKEIVEKSRPGERGKPSNRKSIDTLCLNFEINKSITEILNDYKLRENSSEAEKELKKQKKFSLKPMKDSSSDFLPLEKIISRMNSLENNSVPELGQHAIENENKSEESCIACEKAKDCSISNIIDIEKCTRDVVCDNTESRSIDIALSQCNLDHSSTAEDIVFGSIEMMDKRADWLIDENNLGNENGTNLISDERFVLRESTVMNFNNDKNHMPPDLTLESNINSQNSIRLSDSFVEIINLGSQLSCQSNILSEPYMPEFNFSGGSETSCRETKLFHPENSHSSFGISQAMYIKQRSSFSRQKNNDKAENRISFKLCNSVTKEVEEFIPEVHLRSNSKRYASSDYKRNDGEKKNKTEILEPQKKHTSFMDLGKEFTDSDAEIPAMFNSMNNSSKRRYSFDENSEVFSIKMRENKGIERRTSPENQNISNGQFSCSSFNSESSNISQEIEALCSSDKRSFWNVSRRVHSFVEEWLDKNENDEFNCGVLKKCANGKRLSLKRRRLDLDREEKEEGINIEAQKLFSNHSSEYDRAYMIERFKPNYK